MQTDRLTTDSDNTFCADYFILFALIFQNAFKKELAQNTGKLVKTIT